MNKQLINEGMARCDGLDLWSERYPNLGQGECEKYLRGNYWHFANDLPYVRSHDAVQSVILGLSDWELSTYSDLCDDLCESHYGPIKATALQKCEAVLKAKGLWTKEMEGDV